MTALVKPCVKCGLSKRTASGRCSPCCVAYKKALYQSNKEKFTAINAAWAIRNPEKVKASKVKWKKANPEIQRIADQNRRARKRASGGKLSKGLTEKLFALQKGKCPCCANPLGDNFHLDHIIPLARGGLNIDSNIQLLRQTCNNQKSARHPVDFMQSRGFLL